ncbi:FAD-dependent oxidoreductase [Candidatus Saccharibacteria bacterium]|nr:FAD-dependent oxidoreductase [Candidatus Saccharibacteria bacterium]
MEASEQINASTLLVTLRSRDANQLIAFQPGQYAAISFFKGGRPTPARCFSIVSSPTEQEILQFSMRTRGPFTRGLSAAQIGDVVDVRGPFGCFVLDIARYTDVVLLAGRIGITPFMSVASFATSIQATKRIALLYSCTTQDDMHTSKTSPGANRRRTTSIELQAPGSFRFASHPDVIGKLLNVSLGGAACSMSQRLPNGMITEVTIALPNGENVSFVAMAVHSRKYILQK